MSTMAADTDTYTQPPNLQMPPKLLPIIIIEEFGPLFCVLIATAIGYHHAYQYSREKSLMVENRLTTRILFAAPIYSMYSWISPYEEYYSAYLYFIRECYGVYVIYGFVSLCYIYIGQVENVVERRTIKALYFYDRITLQYCIVKPFALFVTGYLKLSKDYKYGYWSPESGYIYVTTLCVFSVTLATFGLFSLFKTARGLMQTCNPVLKVVTITFIVFGTYWQEVILTILEKALANDASVDPGIVAARYQNWLVSIEMLPTAIAIRYAFPVRSAINDLRNEHIVEYGFKIPPREPEQDQDDDLSASTNSLKSLNPLL